MKNQITIENYSDMVNALFKNGKQILTNITEHQMSLLHSAVGISGEAGELLDAVKKYSIYNKLLDRENVVEELGDLEFYLDKLRTLLNITREETLLHNISKLSVRYSTGTYSDTQAQTRADKLD